MLIFDQLRKDDRSLRILAMVLLAGMLVLMAGLWNVQIVSAGKHEKDLRNQSFRSVRVPGVRGKIFDRNGLVMAENGPRYDINLYLEELPPYFLHEYTNRVLPTYLANNPPPPATNQTGSRFFGLFGGKEPARARLPLKTRQALQAQARYGVASNLLLQVSSFLKQPTELNHAGFQRHYSSSLFVPFPLMKNLPPEKVARFVELAAEFPGVELEVQPVRAYPNGSTAAHLLGYVQRLHNFDSEDINYRYVLPDYTGKTGIESAFDEELRGRPGVKSLLVNNLGYRQREDLISPSEPGDNVFLTLDLPLQIATERALASAMANVRGAAVVVDVRNGDVLAMASLPTFDPSIYVNGAGSNEWARISDANLKPQFNRATQAFYSPGSIFKILTSIACLESGLNTSEQFRVEPNPKRPARGGIYVGNRLIGDTAAPGLYDFEKAFIKSSNSYFIHYGLRAGFKKIVEVGERFHLGERTQIMPRQEAAGIFPDRGDEKNWPLGSTANMCIGQEITVTPIQMAMMTAAVANGGKVFWPRLVMKTQSPDNLGLDAGAVTYPTRLRSDANIRPEHVKLIHQAMQADVESTSGDEDGEGTGKRARIDGYHIGGKTGTAEIKGSGQKDQTTWFTSFAPVENPKYAVVVMVESGGSGGGTCAPVARQIYEAIIKREQGQDLSKLYASHRR